MDATFWVSILSLGLATVSFLRLVYTAYITRPSAELERKDLEIVRALAYRGLTLDTLLRSLRDFGTRSILQHLHTVSVQTRQSIDDAISRGILLPDGMMLAPDVRMSAALDDFALSRLVSTQTVKLKDGDAFWYISLAQMLVDTTYMLEKSDEISEEDWKNSEKLWLSDAFRKHLSELLDSCCGILKKSPFAVDRSTARWLEAESRADARTVNRSAEAEIGLARRRAERAAIRERFSAGVGRTSEV